MKICVVGSGHVGLVTGACFAELGNEVKCIDNDANKVETLKGGRIPFYEPGLNELVARNVSEGRLSFSTDIPEGSRSAEVVFICVGTPPREDGTPDLSSVENVAREIASASRSYKVIVEKSTVPVRTAEWLDTILKRYIRSEYDIASNPEFLREGSAVRDFLHPDRIVIGTNSPRADQILTEVYKPLNAPIVHTDIKSAELIKHCANAFLAMKISFINLVAQLCDAVGTDVEMVRMGIGSDKRIGLEFLNAGLGYGGFCFPKDLGAFISVFEQHGLDATLLKSVAAVNTAQRFIFVQKVKEALGSLEGKALGVLGLSFKPDTDDIRFAPSLDVVGALLRERATIRAYDPQAMEDFRAVFPDVTYCENPFEAAEGADALLILTEWREFQELDLLRIRTLLKNPIIVDGRNMFSRQRLARLGFKYLCMGK